MFSEKVLNNLKNSSWIRAMFDEGERLRKIHGADKVFDFSLGNPDLEPPIQVKDALKALILEDKPGLHAYMSNAGYTHVRQSIADQIKKETGLPFGAEHIIMSVGAGGGLNAILKALLNPGEEVIVFSPFFAEYLFYIDNYGGKSVEVPTDPDTFEPSADILESYITKDTKVVIINSPNNPTGVVYSKECLQRLAQLIEKKEKEYNTTIFVVSDEPYSKIVYDGTKVTSVFSVFKNSIRVDSYSKSLSLPGERIGYIAANPQIQNADLLMNAIIFTTRTLGFVNAPALFQKVVGMSLDSEVNVNEYKKRRDMLYNKLIELGFSCVKPGGAFYLFPKSPIPDDVEFVKHAVNYNLLLVPGRGFGCPGHFRIAYCYSLDMIERSIPAFEKLAKDFIK